MKIYISLNILYIILSMFMSGTASLPGNPQNLPEINIKQGEASVEIPCNTMVRIDEGTTVMVKSQNYPKMYPIANYCLRTIIASTRDSRLRFSCSSFELESGVPSCLVADYLRIWELDPKESKYFCGSELPTTITTTSDIMNIGFYSNWLLTFTGFSCSVTSIGKDTNSEYVNGNNELVNFAYSNHLQSSQNIFHPNTRPCKCGVRDSAKRLIKNDDFEVSDLEYPWMVVIKVRTSQTQMCGGTLIDDKFVLSSSSCLLNKDKNNLEVLLGVHSLSPHSENPFLQRTNVSSVIMHQDFQWMDYRNDIAIVQLTSRVQMAPEIGVNPICLPQSSFSTHLPKQSIIAGWQSYPWAPDLEDEPRQTTVSIFPADVCTPLMDFHVDNSMICGLNFNSGTCQSDEGASMMVIRNDGRFELFGVASFVKNCRNTSTPAVFTKISDHLQWINKNIGTVSSCQGTPNLDLDSLL